MAKLLEAWCFKGIKEVVFLYFCFWFVLLFCKLLWKDLGELVSMMERNLGCSMETLYELCESRLCVWISVEISGSEMTRKRKIYVMLAEVKEDSVARG
jgi:hypothetical protein